MTANEGFAKYNAYSCGQYLTYILVICQSDLEPPKTAAYNIRMKTKLAAKSPRTKPATTPGAEKTLLKDQAYTELKELIQTGIYPPNTFLSERQLVEKLQISKTPIRSALEHLEAQGLVAVSPQQGIVVKELSVRDITELFDMRLAMEPFMASQLASRVLSADQNERLAGNLTKQHAAALAGDALAATRLDIEFHMLIASLLDNREMTAWLTRCFDKLYRSVLRINQLSNGRLLKSQQDHAAIVAAINSGEATAAAKAMTEHLRYGRQFLLGG